MHKDEFRGCARLETSPEFAGKHSAVQNLPD